MLRAPAGLTPWPARCGATGRPFPAHAIPLLAFAALSAGLAVAPAAAQDARGIVIDQLTGGPVAGAVVTALRVFPLDGEPVSGREEPVAGNPQLVPGAVTRSDEDGSFHLSLPGPGEYRLQAEFEGLAGPLSPLLSLRAAELVAELELLVPSVLLMMAFGCGLEADEAAVTVVGVVRDPARGVAAPGARVEARWIEDGEGRTRSTHADPAGRYRLCGLPVTAGTVALQGHLLGRSTPLDEIAAAGPTLVFHDLELVLGSPDGGTPGGIQERVLSEAAARTLGSVSGLLVDALTGVPVQQAVVSLEGLALQALTGGDGRFLFEEVPPGNYRLEIRHLGYRVDSEPVELPAGHDLFLGMRIAPEAILLEGVEVVARSAAQGIVRASPFRRNIVHGEEMALEEVRGARAHEILRRVGPGIRVREQYREFGPPLVCVEVNRRVERLQQTPRPPSLMDEPCEGMAQLVVDGARIDPAAASDFLRTLSAADIESIEVLNALEAGILHGSGGTVANGVVVIHTRGKGPYASPLRDRVP
jgi:hypothetical protein